MLSALVELLGLETNLLFRFVDSILKPPLGEKCISCLPIEIASPAAR